MDGAKDLKTIQAGLHAFFYFLTTHNPCVEFGRLGSTCFMKHRFPCCYFGSCLAVEPKSEARNCLFWQGIAEFLVRRIVGRYALASLSSTAVVLEFRC